MPLGTQKFRTGVNLYRDASIIDLRCATTTIPTPNSGGNTISARHSDIIQDPLSLFTNPSLDFVALDPAHTYELRLLSVERKSYGGLGSYAGLVVTVALGETGGLVTSGNAPFFAPDSNLDFLFQVEDLDSDDDDIFFDNTNNVRFGQFTGTFASGLGASVTMADVTLPKIISNVSVSSYGQSSHISTEWHMARGPAQTLTGPTVRLMVRKTS